MKFAYVDATTFALKGGGWHDAPPVNGTDLILAVSVDFDFTARDKQWDGKAWQPYTAPPPPVRPQGAVFRDAFVGLVDGAGTQAGVDRFAALWAIPEVSAFMQVLHKDVLSAGDLLVLPSIWKLAKAKLSVTEAAAAITNAASYGITLA